MRMNDTNLIYDSNPILGVPKQIRPDPVQAMPCSGVHCACWHSHEPALSQTYRGLLIVCELAMAAAEVFFSSMAVNITTLL